MHVKLFSVKQEACSSDDSAMTGMVGFTFSTGRTTGSGVSSSFRFASGDSVALIGSSTVSSVPDAAAEEASADLWEAEALANLEEAFEACFVSFLVSFLV